MADLAPPILPDTTSSIEESTTTWDIGPPNEFFSNIDNWTTYKAIGSETATIVSNRVRLDIVDSTAGNIKLIYDYPIPKTDFEVIFDLSSYTYDNSADAPHIRLRVSSPNTDGTDGSNVMWIEYWYDSDAGPHHVQCRHCINGAWTYGSDLTPAGIPTSLKIVRDGTYLKAYYFYSSSWTLADSADWVNSDLINQVSQIGIIYHHSNSRGGYVDIDDLTIIPEESYFKNDTFENLDNWIVQDEIDGTASISANKLILDGDDLDFNVSLRNKYSVPQGDFSLTLDIVDYNWDNSTNTPRFSFYVRDDNTGDRIEVIYYYQTNYWCTAQWRINGATNNLNVNPGGTIDKLKIDRVGTEIHVYYYRSSSWTLVKNQDFGSNAARLSIVRFVLQDYNIRGGNIHLDNLLLDSGIDSYNLYWKKDKCPNCYFISLDDWTIEKDDSSETATIIENTLELDLPDSTDTGITCNYNYEVDSGDCEILIDINTYTPDDSTSSPGIFLHFVSIDTDVDTFYLKYNVVASVKTITGGSTVNSSSLSDNELPSDVPLKLKITRSGTTLTSYYYDGSWNQVHTRDFSTRSDNLIIPRISFSDVSTRGGSVIVDNLIVTPSVKDSGTKIPSITDLTYNHTSLDGASVYCYEVTAEGSEGDPGEETYGVPDSPIPDPPTNLVVTPDSEKNDITWSPSAGATAYNIYWSIDYYPEEYFTSLDDWTVYDTGSETIQIQSNQLSCYTPTSGGGSYYIARDTNIPAGDFELEIDLVNYIPGNNNPGFIAYFSVSEVHQWSSVDQVVIYYQLTTTGTVHKVVAETWINSVYNETPTTSSNRPTKLKITRVTNTINTYYYDGSWTLISSEDFSTRAVNLDIVNIIGVKQGGYGGTVIWDNLLYKPNLDTGGAKIADVSSPYEHSSLNAGDNYFYEITAENGSGESEVSLQETGIPLQGVPDAPTGISVVGGEGDNTITFTADGEADETHAYWANSPGVTPGAGTLISDMTSPHVHDSLNPSLTYYYVLTSENEFGEGDPSSEYSDSPIPTVPENLAVTPTIQKNTITWDAVEGADSYNIYWKTTSPVTKVSGTKIIGATSPHEHTSLTPGQIIYYVVAAEDEDGESNISGEQSGIPLLPAPTGVTATATGERNIQIEWNSVSGATSYHIYWRTTTGVTKANGTKIPNETSPYTHSSLTPDQEYFYIVTAENANDESIDSSEVSDIAVIDVVIIASVIGGDSQNTITWNISDAVDSYNIYWSNATGVTLDNGTLIEDVTSPYIHEDLTKQDYYYIVVPVVDSVEHTASDEEDGKPVFEGKIFDHESLAEAKLLYQYQKE